MPNNSFLSFYIAQYYAVKMAISKGPSNKETNAYLSQLLDKLEQVSYSLIQHYITKEKDKRKEDRNSPKKKIVFFRGSICQVKGTLGADNEAITNDLVGYAHIENFALKVFFNADNEDRAGKASK